MIKRSEECDQVDIVIKNLQPGYLERLEYSGVDNFHRLMLRITFRVGKSKEKPQRANGLLPQVIQCNK